MTMSPPPRIVIAADSLALPRPKHNGDIPYQKTYGFLLEKSLQEKFPGSKVLNHGYRSNTIRILSEEVRLFDQILAWKPQIVLLHIGIVDCAPRIFSEIERKIVSRIRPYSLRDWFIQYVGKHRRFIIRNRRLRVYVSLDEFATKYKQVVEKMFAQNIIVLAVNISPTIPDVAYRSPGLSENIEKYNEAIANASYKKALLIDLYKEVHYRGAKECLLDDGIHLSSFGHEVLADLVTKEIHNLYSSVSAV